MNNRTLAAMAVAALSVAGMSGAASADSACGSLPNATWSWSVETVAGSTTSEMSYGDIVYSGNSGNGSADVTTTTTTTPPATICTAINPAGNPVPGRSTVLGGGDPIVETSTVYTQVCFNSPIAKDLVEGCR